MNWTSAAEFFAMGGHGFFVWASYGLAFALMVIEPLLARHRHRQALAACGANPPDTAQRQPGASR
jgi:heme exporter protein D